MRSFVLALLVKCESAVRDVGGLDETYLACLRLRAVILSAMSVTGI